MKNMAADRRDQNLKSFHGRRDHLGGGAVIHVHVCLVLPFSFRAVSEV